MRDGTVVEFETGNGPFSYAARGSLTGLDVRRLGNALNLPALDKPLYDGRVSGAFDVTGSGTALEDLTLKASGTLTDSSIAGMHTPQMAFTTQIADGGLSVDAKGGFDQLNPAVSSIARTSTATSAGRWTGRSACPISTVPFTTRRLGSTAASRWRRRSSAACRSRPQTWKAGTRGGR